MREKGGWGYGGLIDNKDEEDDLKSELKPENRGKREREKGQRTDCCHVFFCAITDLIC